MDFKKIVFIIFFISFKLFASGCYSIETKVDMNTPVVTKPKEISDIKKCLLFESPIHFSPSQYIYIGCYKKYKTAKIILSRLGKNFKNKKIIYHRNSIKDTYIVFPEKSKIKKSLIKKRVDKIYSRYTIDKILRKFPKRFYGNGLEFLDISKAIFLLSIDNYSFYSYWKQHNQDTKILVLYNGQYSLDYIYKKLHNNNLIEKKSKNNFIVKIPIYISPSASLTIENKTVKLETYPKPIFIAYNGSLYIKNSTIITWDMEKNRFSPIPKVSEDKLLLIGKQDPRPFFLGLSNSKSIFINSTFKGLGYHGGTGTFGIAINKYPVESIFQNSPLRKYFLSFLKEPKAILVGNDIKNCEMGFYSNHANSVILLGNYFKDNIIYNVDPHDYSTNLIIARNITASAKHAHGIIISRGVKNTIIAQNISIRNHSAGIMLDRSSNGNIIFDNLSIKNGYMGISIQESDNIAIEDNIIAKNYIDGIMIRNALKIDIKNNNIFGNGKNGIEILTKDIKNLTYRDFRRDPYHLATSAIVNKNHIKNNLNYEIMVKNSAAIKIFDNKIAGKSLFGGDLNPFALNIIGNKNNFTLYGLGYPFIAKSSDLIRLNSKTKLALKKIYKKLSFRNSDAGIFLAYIHMQNSNFFLGKKELEIESANIIPKAIEYLGYALLYKGFNKKNRKIMKEGLTYIFESIILGDDNSLKNLKLLKFLLPVDNTLFQLAYNKALKRVKEGYILDKKSHNNMFLCNLFNFSKKKISSQYYIFKYKMDSTNNKNIFDYSKIFYKNLNIFSPQTIKKIEKLIYNTNKNKIFYYNYMRQIKEKAQKDIYCKRYLAKQQILFSASKKIIDNDAERDFKKLSPYIKKILYKINGFRVQKIGLEEIEHLYFNLKEKNEH